MQNLQGYLSVTAITTFLIGRLGNLYERVDAKILVRNIHPSVFPDLVFA
jgi:hypothetical protein